MYSDDWFSCYKEGWKGVITEASFMHPARFSRSLIRRIYQHASEEGWIIPGSVVLDVFGGVAAGALDAMLLGCTWIGNELEPRFVGIAKENLAEWQHKYGHRPGWGGARILQGDSRNLAAVIREARICVSSPPYTSRTVNGNVGVDIEKFQHGHGKHCQALMMDQYGQAPGNLGNLKASDADLSAALVLASPPYVATDPAKNSGSVDRRKQYESYRKSGGGASYEAFCATQERHSGGYGDSEGQLSAMKDRGFDLSVGSPPFVDARQDTTPSVKGNVPTKHDPEAWTSTALVVSSPPYSGDSGKGDKTGHERAEKRAKEKGLRQGLGCFKTSESYGGTEGQLGAMRESKDGFALSVGSPPYGDSEQSHDADFVLRSTAVNPSPRKLGTRNYFPAETGEDGQLADLSVSSPPYESSASNTTNNHGGTVNAAWKAGGIAARDPKMAPGYGETDGNIGNSAHDDFWSAARKILEQTYLVLAPGAHAIWVLKGFVRKGKYVDFPDQWRQLCEAVGFKTLHWHRCWLVERKGEQFRLDGGVDTIQTEKKSFFRRNAEKKGAPRVDFEVVLCTAKQ